MQKPFVIVGAGQAGLQIAASLRTKGYDGRLILIGDEPAAPYERPPLSKAYFKGETDAGRLMLKPEGFYADKAIELRTGVTVTGADRAARTLTLSTGETLGYAKLALATGAEVRKLPLGGADLDGVLYIRTLADADALKQRATPGKRLVIVGAGYIGLECAAVSAEMGLDVTVLEAQPRAMSRVVAEPTSAYFERAHRDAGVKLHFGAGVAAIEGADGHVTGVRDSAGNLHAADLVVVGVGVKPRAELAEAMGLPVANGIVIDACGRTADPDVFAAGDCANCAGIRLESVQNAIAQGKAAAAAMLGLEEPATEVPWFWSDQYHHKLQIAGLSRPTDTVVARGDASAGHFSVLYLRDGALAAIDTVGALKDFMQAKKLIADGRKIDAVAAADPANALKDL